MKKRWRWILLVLLVLLGAGSFLGDRMLKKRGHPGLVTFGKQWMRNYPKSFAMHPPTIAIEVKEKGMQELEAVVEHARERGVIEQEGNDYVKASFTVDGNTFKGKLRIKGKMTDHVEGKKWSFRVVLKKGEGEFLGMKRFSLQHPGTRNYLCDWFYHQLMRGEGIIALRYGFWRTTETLPDIVTAALQSATKKLRDIEKEGRLDWGKYKLTSVNHLARLAPFSVDGLSVGGGVGCINATKETHGPSWRMIVSLTPNTEAYGVYPGGQSGNPGSKYYSGFINQWAEGKYYTLWHMKKQEAKDKRVKFVMTFSS